jgi:hypothetical protein
MVLVSVIGVLPWFFAYKTSVVVPPGVSVPHTMLDSFVEQAWSEKIPSVVCEVKVEVGKGVGVVVRTTVGEAIGVGVGVEVAVGVGVGVTASDEDDNGT